MTTRKVLTNEINRLSLEINRLKILREKEDHLAPALKKCPECGTYNYHYLPSGKWCCAFC